MNKRNLTITLATAAAAILAVMALRKHGKTDLVIGLMLVSGVAVETVDA